MTTDTNIKPVTAKIVWSGTAQDRMPFAMFDHDGQAYTLCFVANGLNIYRDIEGADCLISQVDTVGEALEFVSLYAGQLI